jgi:hypothetical protein
MAEVAGKEYTHAGHFATQTNFEVQRTNHFEIVLDLDKILSGEGADVAEHIRLSTKDVSTPKISSEAIPLKHGNDTVKVAAAPTYDDLTITVYDTIGRDQVNTLQKWYNKVFDYDTKLMGLVSQYKASGTLYMYSPDCSIIRKWTLEGVWPRSFGMGESFSFDSANAQTVTLELSVDRYHEEVVQGAK